MELRTEYLERALQLEALAADKSDPVFKGQLLGQANAYRKIAAKRRRIKACLRQACRKQIRIPKFNFERNRPSQVKQPMLLRRP